MSDLLGRHHRVPIVTMVFLKKCSCPVLCINQSNTDTGFLPLNGTSLVFRCHIQMIPSAELSSQAIPTPLCIKSFFFAMWPQRVFIDLLYLWGSYRPSSHIVWVGLGIFATRPHGGTVSSPSCYWGSCCCYYLEQFYNIMVIQWNGETGLFPPHRFIQWYLDVCCSSVERLRWQLKVKVLLCEPVIVSAWTSLAGERWHLPKCFASLQYHLAGPSSVMLQKQCPRATVKYPYILNVNKIFISCQPAKCRFSCISMDSTVFVF